MAPASPRVLRSWARRVVATVDDLVIAPSGSLPDGGPDVAADPLPAVAAVVAAVARAVSGAEGGPADAVLADPLVAAIADAVGVEQLPEPPGGWADPWLPGLVHEQAESDARRSARGAWYTPESVVRGLVELAVADGPPPVAVVDPTCGGGAFLLAALDRLVAIGDEPAAAVDRVRGTDIDPAAVRVSRWSIALWAASRGLAVDPAGVAVEVADALEDSNDRGGPGESARVGARAGAASTARTVVVGNPPFATPLRSGRLGPVADAYREANPDLLGPYADLAAIHLLAARRSVGPGSTVALVLPQSVLSGRDTRALRLDCDRAAPLRALWATREAVFDAGVRACAVVLEVGGEPGLPVRLAAGPEVRPVVRSDPEPAGSDRWAAHAARALGAPALPPSLAAVEVTPPDSGQGGRARPRPGALGDLVAATAGFRDEYYGLVDACREWSADDGPEPNRLVTVGSIDPLDVAWGREACRLGGTRWLRPVVDRGALSPKVGSWVQQRLVPKVVLATQSRVLEPVVDRAGVLVPVTPLLALAADPDDLDRVAAVLLAPPVVAWAWQRWFGAALSVDALKLAAAQVHELPLPPDRGAWDEAAAIVALADDGADEPTRGTEPDADDGGARGEVADPGERAALADRVATVMNRAYGADDGVLDWWRSRAAGRSRATGAGRAARRRRR